MYIFHNSNGEDYEVIATGYDKYATPCALLCSTNGKWVAAWNCVGDHGSWGQGHYFNNDEAGARKFFAENYFNTIRGLSL